MPVSLNGAAVLTVNQWGRSPAEVKLVDATDGAAPTPIWYSVQIFDTSRQPWVMDAEVVNTASGSSQHGYQDPPPP